MEATDDVDVTTTLRSELAALQYKRDRLTSELDEMRSQIRTRDQRCLDLQVLYLFIVILLSLFSFIINYEAKLPTLKLFLH